VKRQQRACQRLFQHGVTVDNLRPGWDPSHAVSHVRQIFVLATACSFREIADVEPGQRIGMAGGFAQSRGNEGRARSSLAAAGSFGRRGGGRRRFHADEDRGRVLARDLGRPGRGF